MLTFNKKYFYLTVLLFVTEVLIALFVKDDFVRPYFGDVLVVILMYCFIRSFFKISVIPCAFLVLAIAFAIEYLQYINFIQRVGLQHSRLASTVLGTSFAWEDLIAYAAGFIIILAAENLRGNGPKNNLNER